jgi:hypothetical protein
MMYHAEVTDKKDINDMGLPFGISTTSYFNGTATEPTHIADPSVFVIFSTTHFFNSNR